MRANSICHILCPNLFWHVDCSWFQVEMMLIALLWDNCTGPFHRCFGITYRKTLFFLMLHLTTVGIFRIWLKFRFSFRRVLINFSISRAGTMLDPFPVFLFIVSTLEFYLDSIFPSWTWLYPGLLFEAVRSTPIHCPAHTYCPCGTCARAGPELLPA